MEFFSPFGTIVGLQLFCFDDSKRCTGNGIVHFASEEEAKKAREEGNGKKIKERWIKIDKVKAKNVTMKGKGKGKGKGQGGKEGKGGSKKMKVEGKKE